MMPPASALLTLALSIGGFGQTMPPEASARLSKITTDGAKVELSLKLDREIYFPGERMEFACTVRNGTAFPLEIPDPFAMYGGAFDIFAPHPRWKDIYPDEVGPTNPYPRRDFLDVYRRKIPATRTLAAGEVVSRTFTATDRLPGDERRLIDIGGAPRQAGSYRLVYTLVQPVGAEFRVVSAVLEAFQWVKLNGTFVVPGWPDPRYPEKPLVPKTYPRASVVAALGGDGAHWIVVGGNDRVVDTYLFRKGEPLVIDTGGLLSPYVRVAKSTAPIESISVVAAPDDRLTITWTDANGETGTVRVDKDRRVQ